MGVFICHKLQIGMDFFDCASTHLQKLLLSLNKLLALLNFLFEPLYLLFMELFGHHLFAVSSLHH